MKAIVLTTKSKPDFFGQVKKRKSFGFNFFEEKQNSLCTNFDDYSPKSNPELIHNYASPKSKKTQKFSRNTISVTFL